MRNVGFVTVGALLFLIPSCAQRSELTLPPGNQTASSSATTPNPGGCVDFTITTNDLACTDDSDCGWVDELRVCPNDPSCGFQNPANKAAVARYAQAVAGVPRTSVECGAPAPVGCVSGQCAILPPSACVNFPWDPSTDSTCSTASDCVFIPSLHVCPNDASCGNAYPVNLAAQARYQQAIANISLSPAQCAPRGIDCVQGQCSATN
jgi:hypothetical protein